MPKLSSYAPLSGNTLLGSRSFSPYSAVVGPAGTFSDYVCDGIADNVEISAAIAAVSTAGGGTVYLRAGTYHIASPALLQDNTYLRGAGVATLLTLDNEVEDDVLTNNAAAAGYTSTPLNFNIQVSDLKIDGNKANQVSGATNVHGLKLANVDGFKVERVWAQNAKEGNIVVAGSRNGKVIGCITKTGGIEGYYCTVQAHSVSFIGCIALSEQQGFECKEDIYNFSISSCTFDSCNKGIQVRRGDSSTTTYPYGFSISGNQFYNTQRWPIYIIDGVHDGQLIGNTMTNYSTSSVGSYDGILLGGTNSKIKVIGNSFIDTQTTPTSYRGLSAVATTTNISYSSNTATGILGSLYNVLGTISSDKYLTVGPTGSDADFITDGTADNTEIQLAINAVNAAGGGTVFLKAAIYTLANKLTIQSNITIRGEGKGNTIITLSANANSNFFENSDTTNGNVDIQFHDFTINGNKANQAGGGRGIFMQKVTRPVVENVDIHDTRNRAIHYLTCTEGLIEKASGRSCGVFQEQTFTFESCDGCVYSDCVASGGTDRDFEIAFCTNCELHNCKSVSAVGAGLAVYSTTSTVNSGIIVDGFTAITPQAEGIYLERVQNSQFSNIWVYNPGTEGIRDFGTASFMTDNQFSNINIYNPGQSGLTLDGPRSTLTNIKVYNAGTYGVRILSPENRLATVHVYGAQQDCFWIGPSASNSGMSNCLGKNGGIGAVSGHTNGLRVEALDCQITGSNFFDDQGTKTQDYGVKEFGSANYNIYLGINARNNKTGAISTLGANSIAPAGSNIIA